LNYSLRNDPHPNPLLFKARERICARGLLCAIALLCCAISTSARAAGNVTTGRQKALQCQTCHGLDGLSKLPEAPNLGGQPEPYLVKSLNDFRRGVRKNDMMSLVVQQLSDQDVADLAAFYAAIELTTKPPK
jgi:cytochrome c553